MTFWYLPRSIDTNFLLVYEPYRALEGLEGVGIKLPDFRANEIALLQFNLQDGVAYQLLYQCKKQNYTIIKNRIN